jgi:alpha-mannosidase
MRLSLIRSSFDPDPVPNPGKHTWRYAIRPRGKMDFAEVTREAASFNQPLLSASVPFDARGANPLTYSPLSLSDPRLVPTALKQSEDGSDLIIRFYEAGGLHSGSGAMRFNFPVQSVQLVNFVEDPIGPVQRVSGSTVNVSSTEFKIWTYKISSKQDSNRND